MQGRAFRDEIARRSRKALFRPIPPLFTVTTVGRLADFGRI
jgi:hypothetical protein